MSLRRSIALAVILTAAVLASGCKSVDLVPSSVRVPVLLGPIERIGDEAPRRQGRLDIAPFEGKVKSRTVSASSTNTEVHGGGVYDVHRSAVATEQQDDLSAAMTQALATVAGQMDVVIYLDEVRPYGYVHVGMGWTVAGDGVEVEGAVTRPAAGVGR